jgi:hypothetical protein
MKVVVAALAATALAVLPAAATAAPSDHARQALTQVEQLQRGKGVHDGRELSPALMHLYNELPSLTGDDRAAAQAILARPDDTDADPPDTHKWSGPQAGISPKCSAHFCVHFTAVGSDASNATYAQDMANLLENQVYPCENGTGATACAGRPGLGWRAPASDGTKGGTGCGADSCIDVYIEDLFPSGVFGYVAPDVGQSSDPAVPHYGYLVMDKDFTRFGNGSAASGLAAEEVTAAHEYNHLLQYAYDYREDAWMFESTATYMEDKVYPAVDDYLNYVKHWVANTKQPLTTYSDANRKVYGSAVWNHWLDHRFGAAAVRAAWEDSVGAADFAPGAYGAAVAGAGGAGFSDEFDRFSAAVAEWNTPDAGFPDHYPDVPRDGLLPAGNSTVPFALPHTTFALFDVPIPVGAPTIRLTGTLPAGAAGAVALVGRTGSDLNSGIVTTNLTPMPTGGTAAVSLDNPGQYGRITAVVVNSDTTRAGFDPQADDWIFIHDAGAVTLSLAQPGLPVPTTGPIASIADHSAVVNGTVDPHLLDTSWSVEYGRTTAYGATTAPQAVAAATVGAAAGTAALANLKANTTYHYRVTAANSAGRVVGTDATFTTARDVTKPAVALRVARQKLTRVRKRGLLYAARCSERCTGTATLVLSRSLARRLGLPAKLGSAHVALAARPKSKTLRIRLNAKARKALQRSKRRSLRATLQLHVADESRNAVTLRRAAKLT